MMRVLNKCKLIIPKRRTEDSVMAGIDDIPGLDLGEPAEALPPPNMNSQIEIGGVEDEESSRPSTRGRRDSTKQVVVEEVDARKGLLNRKVRIKE